MAPGVVRYACMIFGLANIVGGIAYASSQDMFMPIAGLLVGSCWFAFGKHGGFPLVNTVADWHPPSASGAIEDLHREGLLVMRRRRWLVWAGFPGTLIVGLFVMELQRGDPRFAALLLAIPLAIINFRYYLSRCPRCGLGFFTKSASRAAFIERGNTCGHCGLSLSAYKKP